MGKMSAIFYLYITIFVHLICLKKIKDIPLNQSNLYFHNIFGKLSILLFIQKHVQFHKHPLPFLNITFLQNIGVGFRIFQLIQF